MSRKGRPRYKAPTETKRIDTEAMIRIYGHPKPERPVVWVDDVKDLMNHGEREYAKLLDANPDVHEWRYEPVSFRLGHACHYNPDFLVVFEDGHLEVHEVKSGRVEEDALVKMKTFSTLYSFLPLFLCQRGKKGWTITRIKHGGPTWSPPFKRVEAEPESEAEETNL